MFDEENPYENHNKNGSKVEDLIENNEYSEKIIKEQRMSFIRKVYGILSFQLMITVGACVVSMKVDKFADYQSDNIGLMIAIAVISIILSFTLFCYISIARKVPLNYIILLIFTNCQAYMISYICSTVEEPKIVVIAAGCTLGIVISLTLYSIISKTDFTMCGGLFFLLGAGLLLFGIFMLIFGNWEPLYVFYCCAGAVLYGFYLIYDTQLIIGGKTHELSIDDYIVGALILYIDIIAIFLRILDILDKF